MSDESIVTLVAENLHKIDSLNYDSCNTKEERLEKQINYLIICVKKQLELYDELDERIEKVVRKVLSQRLNEREED